MRIRRPKSVFRRRRQKTPTETPKSDKTPVYKVAKRRRSISGIFFRLLFYGFWAGLILFAITLGIVRATVSPEDLEKWIVDLVEEQTGGHLAVGRVTFNVLSYVELHDVKFYPPQKGDLEGFKATGQHATQHIAHFDKFNVQFSIPRVFAGRFYINALQLVNPSIALESQDGVFNFQSILNYRQAKFGEAETKVEEDAQDQGGLPPISPELFYLPFGVTAQNIGVQNLQLSLVDTNEGQVTQDLRVSGVSVDLGFNGMFSASELWFSLSSPFHKPLKVEVSRRNSQGKLVEAFRTRAALNTRLQVSDVSNVSFDFAFRATEVVTPELRLEDIGAFFNFRSKLTNNFLHAQIDRFDLNLVDSAQYNLAGTVAFADHKFQQVDYELNNQLDVDLTNLSELVTPFLPDIAATGHLRVENLRVQDRLDLANAQDVKNLIPLTSGAVWLEQIAVRLPSQGLIVEPLNGKISLATSKSPVSEGSQIDLDVDIVSPSASIARSLKEPLGDVDVAIKGLDLKTTARLLWPQIVAPIIKVNVEADQVIVDGNRVDSIDIPLLLDLDADADLPAKTYSLNANFELTDLVDLTTTASCQNDCERFRINAISRFESLRKVHGIVYPIAGLMGIASQVPESMSGTIDMQVSARGKLPDLERLESDKILTGGSLRYNVQLALNKLNAKMPGQGLAVDDFDFRLLTNGSFASQTLELYAKLDSLTLQQPGATEPIEVKKLTVDTDLENSISGDLRLLDPYEQLVSKLSADIFVGRVAIPAALPQPLSGIELRFQGGHEQVRDIYIKELAAIVPDFGVDFFTKTSTAVDIKNCLVMEGFDKSKSLEQKCIKSLNTNTVLTLSPSGNEHLPMNIKTSGNMRAELSLKSIDMRYFDVAGETDFTDFQVEVPAEKESLVLPASVEGLSGRLPFQQTIDLAEYIETTDTGANTTLTAIEKYIQESQKLKPRKNLVGQVAYTSVRPYFPKKRPLRIKRIRAGAVEIDDFEIDVELRQGMLALNQFVAKFLEGQIQGDVQLGLRPTPKDLQMALHLTKLNPARLFGKQEAAENEEVIDATIHLKYNIEADDLSGVIDITSIGADQLNQLFDFIDPYQRDEAIADIRLALKLGDVHLVKIPIKNSFVDLEVDVRTLMSLAKIPLPKISGISIQDKLEDFRKSLNQSEKETEEEEEKDTPSTPKTEQDTPEEDDGENGDQV